MKPSSVHHVAIKVLDLARAERFYCGVLGLPVLRRWPLIDGTGERSIWLDLGGSAFLALERADFSTDPKAEAAPGMHVLALTIEPSMRDRWETELTAAGHPVYQQTDYTLYVRDPDGNRVGLSHWPHDR